MTNQPADETIVVKYIVEAQDAIARAKEFRAQVDIIKEQLKSLAASSGMSFRDLTIGIQNTYRELAKTGQLTKTELTAGIKASNQALRELTGSTQAASSGFSSIAAGIGAAFGFSAISIIRNFFTTFINYAKEAIQAGFEFTKGIYQLNVGVNALRRAGTDITFGDVLTQLQKLKSEFGIFSTKDLVVGASAFLNLNRDMGFTEDQLFDLQEAIATLAVVNGRAMDEVQKTVALALSSGYTEGLQRLGVSINRVTIAEEAARLGWDKGYTALTEQQRALATYNLILEKTSVYSDDLLSYQKTLPGVIDTANAELTDQAAIIGNSLLPYYAKLLETWTKLVKQFRVYVQFSTGLKGVQEKAIADREEILGRELTTWEKITEKFKAGADYSAAIINDAFYGIPMPTEMMIPETPIIPKEVEALTEDQIAAAESAAKELLKLQTDYDNDRRDLAIDLQRDLARIEAEGAEKIEDIMAAHAQKMLDIANKARDAINNLEAQYALDVQQAWDDYYNNVASLAESNTNKLLKIEEDYQEKLKRLKEGFLLDMEDALQARDARQVLQLIRRYNLEKAQAARERDSEIREQNRAHQEQLHELERQRNARLKKLREELELRERMLLQQRDRELALENEAYLHKMAQQAEENQKDIEARKLKYQQDLDDLVLHLQDRLKALAEGLINENDITGAGLNAMLDTILSYLGPNGAATQVYMNFAAAAQAAIAAALAALMQLQAIPAMIKPIIPNGPHTGKHAQGGIEYANKATTAVFGEAGPELALFLPLRGGIGSISSSTNKTPVPEMKQGDKGKLQVEVLLGAGLEGRIIDKALNNVASVILRSVRQ